MIQDAWRRRVRSRAPFSKAAAGLRVDHRTDVATGVHRACLRPTPALAAIPEEPTRPLSG